MLWGGFGLAAAQQPEGFVVKGCIPGMKDGINVLLIASESQESVTLVETFVKDGCFELRGKVDHPLLCTFITNNLEIVSEKQWPSDSIRWTYTPVFVDNVEMTVEADSYADVPSDWTVTPRFRIKGGEVQKDFSEYHRMLYRLLGDDTEKRGEKEAEAEWAFILSHPQSVVSAMFANRMLLRGYNLSKEQVETLGKAITGVPADTARFAVFKERLEYAKLTTVGAPLINLEMTDVNGTTVNLTDVVPHGKFVLVDFWASWCGMCLYAMPRIRELEEQYGSNFTVIAVSCDKDLKAWRGAMERKNMPWPQYVLTKQGYDDFFYKYQVRNGVPYYTLIAPDGKVMKAPSGPDEIERILEHYCK